MAQTQGWYVSFVISKQARASKICTSQQLSRQAGISELKTWTLTWTDGESNLPQAYEPLTEGKPYSTSPSWMKQYFNHQKVMFESRCQKEIGYPVNSQGQHHSASADTALTLLPIKIRPQ